MSVYFAQRKRGRNGRIKIGHSRIVFDRLQILRSKLIGAISGGREVEKKIHARFTHLRVDGEWFLPGEDLLEFIRTKAQNHVPDQKSSRVQLRFSPKTWRYARELQRKLQKDSGSEVSFSSVVIRLIERSLDHEDRGPSAILSAVTQYRNGLTRKQLVAVTGYRLPSIGMHIRQLHADGLVEQVGEVVLATAGNATERP